MNQIAGCNGTQCESYELENCAERGGEEANGETAKCEVSADGHYYANKSYIGRSQLFHLQKYEHRGQDWKPTTIGPSHSERHSMVMPVGFRSRWWGNRLQHSMGLESVGPESMGLESTLLGDGPLATPRYPSGPSGSRTTPCTRDDDGAYHFAPMNCRLHDDHERVDDHGATDGESSTTGTYGGGLRSDGAVIDGHRVFRNRAWGNNGGRLVTKAVSPKYSDEEMTRMLKGAPLDGSVILPAKQSMIMTTRSKSTSCNQGISSQVGLVEDGINAAG